MSQKTTRRKFLKQSAQVGLGMVALGCSKVFLDRSFNETSVQEKERTMKIENLKMAPFNTTLMGVIEGVARYFEIDASDAMLFGGSGHAFLINIHKELCPSGPYCWNGGPFVRLVHNLGVDIIDLGFFNRESAQAERAAVEKVLKERIGQGIPCSLRNMENQLITGYDETGFDTARPWECNNEFPPARLTFGTWAEFGDNYHATFLCYKKIAAANPKKSIIDSLEYAVDLYRHPLDHTSEDYGAGPNAYIKWINAVENGLGNTHGNWWNGTVWAECRAQASEYFREIASKYDRVASAARDLAADYDEIAKALSKASDKDLASEDKVKILQEAADREAKCIPKIEQLAAALG